ncbi:hypothetical protein ACWEQL_41390, partial [Kitasatospora sp. NPDC004240]
MGFQGSMGHLVSERAPGGVLHGLLRAVPSPGTAVQRAVSGELPLALPEFGEPGDAGASVTPDAPPADPVAVVRVPAVQRSSVGPGVAPARPSLTRARPLPPVRRLAARPAHQAGPAAAPLSKPSAGTPSPGPAEPTRGTLGAEPVQRALSPEATAPASALSPASAPEAPVTAPEGPAPAPRRAGLGAPLDGLPVTARRPGAAPASTSAPAPAPPAPGDSVPGPARPVVQRAAGGPAPGTVIGISH